MPESGEGRMILGTHLGFGERRHVAALKSADMWATPQAHRQRATAIEK